MRFVCVLAVVLSCWLSGSNCIAQDEVGWGGLSMSAFPGYSFYALPVANAGLGRDWVKSGDLQWQVGYNYSVVPLRIEFEHRMPNAFTGRIEVETKESFYPEESATNYPAVYSQDILVPPSIHKTYMFAPRVCPESQIMGPVEFTVRLYKDGVQNPFATQTVSAIQLEPGYLHSLWLDGPGDADGNPAVVRDLINPENTMNLHLPEGYIEAEGILSSSHFLISVDHRQVTGLPLAARDFAFVVADISQVRTWPEEEQLALVTYMTAGGHLCVYNAGAQPWMGLELDQPSTTGRGIFLPVAGGILDARKAVIRWLEGELEEFTLWSGGTSSDWRIGDGLRSGRFGASIKFLDEIAMDSQSEQIVSHRPGYLNPVWIYREACRSGALEIWDSPLIQSVSQNNHAVSSRPSSDQSGGIDKPPSKLSHLAVPFRGFSPVLQVLLVICPLLVALVGIMRRRRIFVQASLSLVIAAGLYSTITASVNPPGSASLALIDADARCSVGSLRSVTATNAGQSGGINVELPSFPIMRHLTWEHPAQWKVTQEKAGSNWVATSVGSQVILASDSAAPLENGLPVQIETSSEEEGTVTCRIDTGDLPSTANCLMQLPSGWLVLQGGVESTTIKVQLPVIPVEPGKQRLQAWSDYLQEANGVGTDHFDNIEREARACLKYITRDDVPLDLDDEFKRLGWTHLTKLSSGMRGAMQNHGVVFVQSPDTGSSTRKSKRETVYWRITFPLEASK